MRRVENLSESFTAGPKKNREDQHSESAGRKDYAVSEQILELIRDLRLSEGDRVPTEHEIAETLKLSRQRARAGLLRLESLGILQAKRGSGRVLLGRNDYELSVFFEPALQKSPSDILDALLVRQVLELGFLPSAMSVITEKSIERMNHTLDEMEAAVRDRTPFPQVDREFHNALFVDLGNEMLSSLLNNFWDLFEGIEFERLVHREDPMETVRHHRQILQAVRKGETRLAVFHLEMHFYDSVESVRDLVSRSPN